MCSMTNNDCTMYIFEYSNKHKKNCNERKCQKPQNNTKPPLAVIKQTYTRNNFRNDNTEFTYNKAGFTLVTNVNEL